jgi:DNA topoisomerase-3
VAKALILTEKPSVARDIAAALGGFTEHDGYWESDDYLLTFAVGHLFELLEPEELDPKYKRWTLDVLPILPDRFEIKKKKGQSDRIRVIKSLATRDDVDRIVNACDAGREGELIFREVVTFLGVEKPVERLWLQSMTGDAIRGGFGSLRPGRELEGLGQASECRARADWLIGMNATRALTKRLKSRRETRAWSAGRVQTPTLALLVDRELEVLAHVPVAYWRVLGRFEHGGHVYEGTWFDPAFEEGGDDQRKDDRIFDEARARAVVEAANGQPGHASETRKPSRESAPPLFDLTSLQREGNRRFGWSARRVLGAAQRCYEAHKVLTYPRTDSRCLPSDYRETVNEVLGKLAAARGDDFADYARAAKHLQGAGLQNTGRVFDDKGVSDHFAIIPTGVIPTAELRGDDRRVYDLVVRRFLGAFHPHAVWERVERTTEVAGQRFRTRARALMEPGWRTVLPESESEEAAPLAPLQPGANEAEGVAVATQDVHAESEETRPPARITEARLLSLMENAGKNIEDENLARVLHEKGLGTPATRAETIENLIAKGYVIRVGKALRPTVKGVRLIDTLRRIHIDRLASAALTGEIEQHLTEVESGGRTAADFMGEMADYAKEIVERAKGFEYEELYENEPPLGACPACGRPVREYAWFYRCEPQPGVVEAYKAKPKKAPKAKKGEEEKPPEPEGPEDCPLRFWKDTSGRYVDRATVAALLRDGKSGLVEGFVARGGRTYKGHLEVDHDEWRVKVVSEGWSEESAIETPEYDVNPEPLGPCPQDPSCEVIETPTHFACRTRLAADETQAAYREARRLARERKEPTPPKPEPPPHPGVTLPRTVCKREITRDEALVYLREGKTELLPEFTSRFGRPFSAYLLLKENGRHGFEFPPRGAAAGGDRKASPGKGKKASRGKGKKKTADAKTTKPRKVVRRRKTGTKAGTNRRSAARPAGRKGTRRSARRPSSK